MSYRVFVYGLNMHSIHAQKTTHSFGFLMTEVLFFFFNILNVLNNSLTCFIHKICAAYSFICKLCFLSFKFIIWFTKKKSRESGKYPSQFSW